VSGEELLPLWALNKAAKAAGWNCWEVVPPADCFSGEKRSIIAHARTIAQYEQPPVDEDRAALQRILDALGIISIASHERGLAQFKRELDARK
jgi:hypothetical protein